MTEHRSFFDLKKSSSVEVGAVGSVPSPAKLQSMFEDLAAFFVRQYVDISNAHQINTIVFVHRASDEAAVCPFLGLENSVPQLGSPFELLIETKKKVLFALQSSQKIIATGLFQTQWGGEYVLVDESETPQCSDVTFYTPGAKPLTVGPIPWNEV